MWFLVLWKNTEGHQREITLKLCIAELQFLMNLFLSEELGGPASVRLGV